MSARRGNAVITTPDRSVDWLNRQHKPDMTVCRILNLPHPQIEIEPA
jgi:hypothetical protein